MAAISKEGGDVEYVSLTDLSDTNAALSKSFATLPTLKDKPVKSAKKSKQIQEENIVSNCNDFVINLNLY